MTPAWTSWSLGRLDLGPADLADRVLRATGLPDTDEGREIVELHLAALDVSLDVGSPELLVPQLCWERVRRSQVSAAAGQVPVWSAVHEVLADRLDELTLAGVVRHAGAAETAAAALRSRAWAQRGAAGLSGLGNQVQTYLAHAVAGRHERAVEHVTRLLDEGTPVEEVLLEVIAPAQRELGRLWERGVVNVAQEHIATAVTQITLSALFPHVVAPPRLDRVLVAATPPDDSHEIGLRIVTDLFRLRGWDTRYVGASCPVPDLVETVVASDASLLLLGASMTSHLPGLRRTVEQVRAEPRCDRVAILVGGEPFTHSPALGEWVGADHVAVRALEALEVADGLLEVREATGR